MSLAWLAAQKDSCDIPDGKAVEKWQVFRWLCEGKAIIGVSDRTLAVLAALLSFYPDNELSEENGLVVFPSNKQLSLRAHGMPDTTLRRHLTALLDFGLICRRDSPNGKRYARKGRGGGIEEAFGFSLAPLLTRAEELQEAAERVQAECRALKLIRERITLQRRDIAKLIEVALEERVAGDWNTLWQRFRRIVDGLPRRAPAADLEAPLSALCALRDEVDNLLNLHIHAKNMDGNESHNGRHYSNSNTNPIIESEPAFDKSRVGKPEPKQRAKLEPKGYHLALVLKACPEICEYAIDGIKNWRDLMATSAQVRGYLGISPSAYAEALEALGPENAAIVIACILERANYINSAGGYLRVLTEKARGGEFTVGPMLMAALKANSSPGQLAG